MGDTPVELVAPARLLPFPVTVVHAAVFALSEGREQHCSSTYRQPIEIWVGSDPINRLTHR